MESISGAPNNLFSSNRQALLGAQFIPINKPLFSTVETSNKGDPAESNTPKSLPNDSTHLVFCAVSGNYGDASPLLSPSIFFSPSTPPLLGSLSQFIFPLLFNLLSSPPSSFPGSFPPGTPFFSPSSPLFFTQQILSLPGTTSPNLRKRDRSDLFNQQRGDGSENQMGGTTREKKNKGQPAE